MEKIKEVENGSGLVELGCFVVIFDGYKARPIVKMVWLVRETIEFSIVALPYVWMLVGLKLVLNTNSRHEIEFRFDRIATKSRIRV